MQDVSEFNWVQEDSIWIEYYRYHLNVCCYQEFLSFVQKHASQVIFELKSLKHLLKEDKKPSMYRWYAFNVVCLAGGLVSFCNGFNGMTSVLVILFPNIFLTTVMLFGLVAALSALAIFMAQDKPALLDNFQIYPEILLSLTDEYLFHIQMYLHHQQQQGQKTLLEELPKYYALRALLKSKKNDNQKTLESNAVVFQSNLIIGMGAILYFSDSFFVGQSMMYLFGQFLLLNTFLLNLAFGVFLGVLGLIYYWGRERPSLEQFLQGEWFTDNNHTEESMKELQADIHELEFGLRCSY